MANVISSLLVGIGFETDKKSAANVESAIDGIQAKALQLGGLVAGAFGANALTFGFAKSYDELGKFGERWSMAANDVIAYDRALQHAGGSEGEFFNSVQRLTQLQAQSAQNKASLLAGLAPEGIAGQVQGVINAKDAVRGFLKAADALKTLDPKRQERFIKALGFSDSEVRLLRTGRDGILSAVNAEKKLRPAAKQMTDTAAKFNDEWQDLSSNVGSFSDKVATPLLKGINSILTSTNKWIDANREVINSFSGFAGNVIGKNIDTIAVGLTALSAAGVISGLKAVGGLLSGITGSLAAGAATAPLVAGITALYAIIAHGDKGDFLSAGSLFGNNSVTDFLDKPIGSFFSSSDNKPQPARISNYVQQQAGISQQQSATQQGGTSAPIQIQNQVVLDGRVIDERVNNVIGHQAEQAVQDLSNSEGG